jgi:hypothetical protein
LQYFKEDIKRLLTARINKGALQGNYNVTAAIWRMKQLGEKDPDKHQESSNPFANTVFKIITQDVEADSD